MASNLETLAEYITTLKVKNVSETGIRMQRWRLDKFLAYLADRDITEIEAITKENVREYQIALYHSVNPQGRPNGIAHQNNMLAAVKCFLKFAKERDLIISDPSRDVPYGKQPKALPRSILTPAEARRIVCAPDTKSVIGYRDRTILEVLYSTGIRREELNKLTLSDVDYVDGILRINEGKGRKDRVVPVGRIACRYLENYIKSVRPRLVKDSSDNHLFLSSKKGTKLNKDVACQLVKKYAQKAGVKKNVSPHTFRHTCATAMLKNRADLRALQELLGHASLNTTQIYTRITINDLKEVHQRCHPREKDKE